jgi:hypothetical protein
MDTECDYSLPIRSQLLLSKIQSVFLFKSDFNDKKH